jgi:hypothetical protein
MRTPLLIIWLLIILSCSRSPRFELLGPEKTSISFSNFITESDSFNILTYEYIYNGAGVGLGDLNNDGLEDIVFAGNQVSSGVYLNLGDFKFKDISSNLTGLSNDQWYSGVTLVDINDDGWLDIYLTSSSAGDGRSCKNRLWVNDGSDEAGGPVFTEKAEEFGIAGEDQSVSAAFFDYDLDGYIDLYVLNNTVNKQLPSAYRKKVNDGSASDNDRLYHNNGNGTFTDVSLAAGIIFEGYGMGLAVSDINKDGFPDIYISNDLLANDVLYINQGDGTFRNRISDYLSYQSLTSKGNDIADLNNDGMPEIFTLDVLPESYARKKQTINGFNYWYYQSDEYYGFEHQYQRNMLHLNNGILCNELIPFSEIGQLSGIYETDWSWSCLFADYDNDGDRDLLVTNGFPKDIRDKDWTRIKATATGNLASEWKIAGMAPALKIPNLAFENIGNLNFVKRTDWMPEIPSCSTGASAGDLDNDGDLDYVVNNINSGAFILKNKSVEKSGRKSNYVRIRLKGETGNIMGYGAKTEIWTQGKYQYDEHFTTRGYASSVDPVIHFGISQSKTIDSIKVTWPATGKISLLKNISSGQTLNICESDALTVRKGLIPAKGDDYIFNKCDSVLDYLHRQTDFNDYNYYQRIIPHKFSQIGPRMAKGDLDGDGREDLIIGSTGEMPVRVYLRKGQGFVETEYDGLDVPGNAAMADLAIVDIDNDGDNDVVSIAGGYELSNESDYRHYLFLNNGSRFERRDLPIPRFPASVIRACDFNRDGFTDLFIGARIKLGMYPYSNHSWIIRNDSGKLTTEPVFRLNLGLVTDAVWTDYDNDGWEDLMVAREWNSLVVVKNVSGKDLVPQYIPELESKHGIWYSLAQGDFDGDGDIDYIAGNLGENNRFNISDSNPLKLYVIDFDQDGIIDPLITGCWRDSKGILTRYPLNYLDDLWAQSGYFRLKYLDYTSFSYSGFSSMVSESLLKKEEFELSVNTASSYVLWNDKGRFTFEKLPPGVQLSPVKKMIVFDFNHDSQPDILIGGNDYTYDISTGYFDANKGLLLINKLNETGRRTCGFAELPPSESGLLLRGMVESLLLFDGDTALIVGGINRNKAFVFRIE